MNRTTSFSTRQQAALVALLGLAIFSPLLLRVSPSLPWMPEWLGAATAGVGLFGALAVFWRAGALRARYLLLFATAIATAAALGILSGRG